MQVRVARWGNSLGLRIPIDIAQRAGLREGARVDVEVEGACRTQAARPAPAVHVLLKEMEDKCSMRYATSADLRVISTGRAIERDAKMLRGHGESFAAVAFDLPSGEQAWAVMLGVSRDGNVDFLTEDEARARGIQFNRYPFFAELVRRALMRFRW